MATVPREGHVSNRVKRFVRRAEYLKAASDFLEQLKISRASWNEGKSDYPINGRDEWQDFVVDDGHGAPIAYPPALKRAHDRGQKDFDAYALIWRHFLIQLCRAFWWPRLFPYWMQDSFFSGHKHPAMAFVAACLVGDPRDVPAELVIDSPPQVISSTLDFNNDKTNPAERQWEATAGFFVSQLPTLLADQPEILEQVNELWVRALMVGMDARERWHLTADRHLYIEVTPDPTGKDWDHIRAAVDAANEDWLAVEAWRLRHEPGTSRTTDVIAELTGVSRQHAERLLARADDLRRQGRT